MSKNLLLWIELFKDFYSSSKKTEGFYLNCPECGGNSKIYVEDPNKNSNLRCFNTNCIINNSMPYVDFLEKYSNKQPLEIFKWLENDEKEFFRLYGTEKAMKYMLSWGLKQSFFSKEQSNLILFDSLIKDYKEDEKELALNQYLSTNWKNNTNKKIKYFKYRNSGGYLLGAFLFEYYKTKSKDGLDVEKKKVFQLLFSLNKQKLSIISGTGYSFPKPMHFFNINALKNKTNFTGLFIVEGLAPASALNLFLEQNESSDQFAVIGTYGTNSASYLNYMELSIFVKKDLQIYLIPDCKEEKAREHMRIVAGEIYRFTKNDNIFLMNDYPGSKEGDDMSDFFSQFELDAIEEKSIQFWNYIETYRSPEPLTAADMFNIVHYEKWENPRSIYGQFEKWLDIPQVYFNYRDFINDCEKLGIVYGLLDDSAYLFLRNKDNKMVSKKIEQNVPNDMTETRIRLSVKQINPLFNKKKVIKSKKLDSKGIEKIEYYDKTKLLEDSNLVVQVSYGWQVSKKEISYYAANNCPPHFLPVDETDTDIKELLNFFEIFFEKTDDYFYQKKWLFAWILDLEIDVMDKKGTAICLSGKEGIGKGIFTDIIRIFVGDCNFVSRATVMELESSDFRDELQGVYVCAFNENISEGGDLPRGFEQMMNIMKEAITTNSRVLNRKYRGSSVVPDKTRFIFSSNNIFAVSRAGVRRFAMFNVADWYMKKYGEKAFDKLKKDLHIKVAKFKKYLVDLNNKGFFKDVNLRIPPQTLLGQINQEDSVSFEIEYLRDSLEYYTTDSLFYSFGKQFFQNVVDDGEGNVVKFLPSKVIIYNDFDNKLENWAKKKATEIGKKNISLVKKKLLDKIKVLDSNILSITNMTEDSVSYKGYEINLQLFVAILDIKKDFAFLNERWTEKKRGEKTIKIY